MKKSREKLNFFSMFIFLFILFSGIYLYQQHDFLQKTNEVRKKNMFEPSVIVDGQILPKNITEDTLLKKGTYIVNTDLVIDPNVTLEVEAGTVITFSLRDPDIIVKGILKLRGSSEDNIIFNYERQAINAPIQIFSTGTLDVTYTKIVNQIPGYDSRNGNSIENNGELKLDHVELQATGGVTSATGNIVNHKSAEIMNSIIPADLIVDKESDFVSIQNNTIGGVFKVALECVDLVTFSQIKNNKASGNGEKIIKLTGVLTQSVRLYKQQYEIETGLTIPEHISLVVEAGSTITFPIENTSIYIKGTLNLYGIEEEKVNFKYHRTMINAPVVIAPTGILEATYVDITNIVPGYNMKSGNNISNNGTLKLDHVKFQEDSTMAGNMNNYGNLEISNSIISGKVTLNEGSSNVILKNNTLRYMATLTAKPTGVVIIKDNQVSYGDYAITFPLQYANQNTFSNITGNIKAGNTVQIIELTGTPTTNIKLPKQEYVFSNGLMVPENTLFEVEAGTTLKVVKGYRISVKGTFNLAGTSSEPITLMEAKSSEYWGGINIYPTGIFLANHSTIRYAGSSYNYLIENQGQLIIWNSEVLAGYSSRVLNYNTENLNQILINNSITGKVTSNIPINAQYNYWNSKTGPKRYNADTATYVGTGSEVSNNIHFYPYNETFIKNNIESLEYLDASIYEMPRFGKLEVDAFTGNYSKKYIDFEIPNRINVDISRTYNSKNKQEGILGYGWSFSFSSKIEPHPYITDSYIVYLPDSSVNIFTKQNDQYQSINSHNTLKMIDQDYIFETMDQITYTYNSDGRLKTITDSYGNITQFIYNKNDLLEKIVDPFKREYQFQYNENRLLSKIIDPENREILYYYNLENLLTKVTNVNKIDTIYTYNSSKQLTSIKENSVIISKIQYMTEGIYKDFVSKITSELGNVVTYQYDNVTSSMTETDSNGRVTKKYYDRDGSIYRIIYPDNTRTTYTYTKDDNINKYGDLESVTTPNTAKTIYTRDINGNITKITNPDSSTKRYVYNSKNKLIKEFDELGNITQYIYDTDEITLLKKVRPQDGTSEYIEEEKDNFQIIDYSYYTIDETNGIKGLMKTKTDENGITTYEYNSYGDIKTIIDGNHNKIVYTKNKIGWILSEQVNNGYITEYEYDSASNIISIKKNSKLISKTEYNYQNKPVKIFDGNCTLESEDPLKSEASLSYQKKHFLLQPTKKAKEVIEGCSAILYEYDAKGNIIKQTDRQGNITSYQYDLYGNLITQTSPNGSILLYEYDHLDRLTKIYYKDTEESEVILLEEKKYTVGASSTITTKKYITETDFKTNILTYNNRNWLISEQNENITRTKTYLKNGLISAETNENGVYTYYFYNKLGQMYRKNERFDDNYYINTDYTYDHVGRLKEEKKGKNKISSSNGNSSSYITTSYFYDNIGNVIKKISSSGEEFLYTYDSYGNMTSEKSKISDDLYHTKTYEYNYLNKVVKEVNEGVFSTYEYDNVGNLLTSVTGENVVTKYEYDKNDRVVKKILDDKIQEELFYDNMGNVIKKVDANGNVTEYQYDKRNNKIKEINPKKLITTYSYDQLNRVTESKDPNNKITSYLYDKFDNIIQKTINNEKIYQYTYDQFQNLTKEIDPLGNSTIYVYNRQHKPIKITDKLGNYKTYEYDTFFNVIKETNEIGRIYSYEYDERSNLITKKIGSIIVEQNQYDLRNNLIKKIDGRSNATIYEYNTRNQLIKKEDALGYCEEYEYNKNGNLIKVTDNLGKQILNTYDNRGNLLKVVEQKEDGSEKIEISKEYDFNNNLMKEIDGNGNITIYTYDSLNNVIKKKDSLNRETTYEYDNNNNLLKETNYLGDSKIYTYNIYDQLVCKKDELGQITEKLEYDLNGRQTKSIDALENATTYVYDKMDRVIEIIDPADHIEKKSYDAIGNQIKKVDSNGNVTTYTYNILNKLTRVVNALNETTVYTYDNNGNLLSVTDGNGKKTEYTYDKMNHELTEKDPLGNTQVKEYYLNGLVKKMTTKNGALINYTYDIHDRKVSENDIVYEYDNNNNLIKISEKW